MSDPSPQRPETLPTDQTPGEPPYADRLRLQTLFEEWLLLREQGQNVLAAELCRPWPHLGAQLAEEIALHLRFEPPDRRGTGAPEPPVREFAGLRYQPLRFHAQGGLGVVFVARDTEVGRDVALKRIRQGRQHLPQDRERFPREAEITGRLEHPGIVPVYSVGRDAAGHPFYTMRLVEGRTLAEAVEAFHRQGQGEHHPGLRRLLSRFVAVCQTVAYAHSRGVIHRDLKPGNILLGDYGETLVIDWGLARQQGTPDAGGAPDTSGRSAETGSGTQTGRELGTRAYMSPEQARGDWANVGPASDEFSLGATLYAILTGRAPYRGSSAPDDARSAKFARPRQVSRAVPAALEAVCLKAMAFRPEDRYPGAQDLAADVQHWLDDEPVQAHREPLSRRLGRWGRRHRTAVAAGLVLLAAGVVGLALGLWAVGHEQTRTAAALREAEANLARATAAEKDAQANLVRAEANLKLARLAIDESYNVAKGHPLFQEPRMEQARKLLLEKTLPFYRNFRAQRPDDPALQREEAEQWFRVGYIEQTLGRTTEGLKAYAQGRDLLVPLARAYPDVPGYRHELATAYNNRGLLLHKLGKGQEALQEYQHAHDLEAKLAGDHPNVPEYQTALARSHQNRAHVLENLGRREEALQEYRQAQDLQAQLPPGPNVPEFQNQLARLHNNRGYLLETLGKGEEALKEFQQALDLQAKLVQAHPKVPEYQHVLGRTHRGRGLVLKTQGKSQEALKEYQRAHDLLSELVQTHPDVPDFQCDLARLHNDRGMVLLTIRDRKEEALEGFRQAEDLAAKLAQAYSELPDYQHVRAQAHNNRAVLLTAQNKREAALGEYGRAHRLQRGLVNAHPDVPVYTESLGLICWHRGLLLGMMDRHGDSLADFNESVALLEQARRLDPLNAMTPMHLLMAVRWRAEVLVLLGRPRDADADWDRALALAPADQRLKLGLAWAVIRARLGDYPGAVAAADDMARAPAPEGATLYDLACVMSLSAAAASRDNARPQAEREKDADQYARRAVVLLHRAHKEGFFRDPADRAHLDVDTDLDFLRTRDDYRAFVKTLPPRQP